jgi:hypothetical protein
MQPMLLLGQVRGSGEESYLDAGPLTWFDKAYAVCYD